MSKILSIVLIACVLALLTPGANAKILWDGDYDTGNIAQWSYHTPCMDTDSYNKGGYSISQYPRYQMMTNSLSGFHIKLKAYPGDGCSGINASSIGLQKSYIADVRTYPDIYYGFSYKIGENFGLLPNEWVGVQSTSTSWEQKNQATIGGTVFALIYQQDRIDLSRASGQGVRKTYKIPALTPAQVGVWNEFIYHIKYSKTATGKIELFHRIRGASSFVKVFELSNIITDYTPAGLDANSNSVYVAEGLSRGSTAAITIPQAVYYDNNHVATTYNEILSTFETYQATPTPITPKPTVTVTAIPTPTVTATTTPPIPTPTPACPEIITWGHNPATGEYKQFPTSCLPSGWEIAGNPPKPAVSTPVLGNIWETIQAWLNLFGLGGV